jgi:hypothetical protein
MYMQPIVKKLMLGFFLLAVAVLFWTFIGQVLFRNPNEMGEHFWSLQIIGLFGFGFVLYGVAMSLVCYLVRDRAWAQAMVFFGVAPYFVAVESVSTKPPALIAFLLFWIAAIVMREWVSHENDVRIELSVDKAIAPNLAWFFTALAAAMSVAFYLSPATLQLKDIRIPREVFQKMISPIEMTFQPKTDLKVQDFVGIPQGAMPKEAAGASGTTQSMEQQIQQKTDELLKRIARPFSGSPQPTGPYSEFSDALYNAFNNRIASIGNLPPALSGLIAMSLAIMLFFSVRLIAIPLGWIVIVLCIIIVNVLTYVGFARITTIQVEKEQIEL